MAGLKIHATQEGELAGSVHSLLVIVVVCALIITTIILLSPGKPTIVCVLVVWLGWVVVAGLKIHATQEGELAGSVHSLLVIVVVCALIISTIILLSPGNFLIIINVCNWVLGVARYMYLEDGR